MFFISSRTNFALRSPGPCCPIIVYIPSARYFYGVNDETSPRLPPEFAARFMHAFQIYELQALDRDEADLELHLRRDWMKDDLRSVPRGY